MRIIPFKLGYSMRIIGIRMYSKIKRFIRTKLIIQFMIKDGRGSLLSNPFNTRTEISQKKTYLIQAVKIHHCSLQYQKRRILELVATT